MKEPSGRRFKDAGEAFKELRNDFNAWCEILTSHSLNASYAIIAANWAVHKGIGAILNNPWAKWSMASVVGFLGINLLINGLMTLLHYFQLDNARENPQEWRKKFENPDKWWPYTDYIEYFGFGLRLLKVIAPAFAALCFLFSLSVK